MLMIKMNKSKFLRKLSGFNDHYRESKTFFHTILKEKINTYIFSDQTENFFTRIGQVT